MPAGRRALTSLIGVVLIVGVVVVMSGVLSMFVLQMGEGVTDTSPSAVFEMEYDNLDDGVAKNDTITITHAGGAVLARERLEVVVGDQTVYNETADSETTNTQFEVPGLVVEVNPGDEFNDLNKPCRVDGDRVSPTGTCGGPPGDSDGSDSGVVLNWAHNVSAGQSVVIQERNDPRSVDVVESGETVRILYRGDGFSALVAEETVPDR